MKKWIALVLAIGALCCSGCVQENQTPLSENDRVSATGSTTAAPDTTDTEAADVTENITSDREESAPAAIPSHLTRNSDGSYTLLLPVVEYFDEERDENEAVYFDYNDYGNIIRFRGEFSRTDEILSQVEYDDAGRPVSFKESYYKEEYNYTYDENGTLMTIEGLVNRGDRGFRFTRTTENGAAWEMSEFWESSVLVKRYDANYRLLECGRYEKDADPSTYEATQRFTYDKYGRLVQWDSLKNDIVFTYTEDDFDAMGHCLTKNGVSVVPKDDGSGETEVRPSTRAWTSQTETDDQGRVIQDVHAYADDPESPYIITYRYEYDGDALLGFTYATEYTTLDGQFLEFVYQPVTLHCDELQIAFLMIYGQDLPADQANSTRGFSVDMNY